MNKTQRRAQQSEGAATPSSSTGVSAPSGGMGNQHILSMLELDADRELASQVMTGEPQVLAIETLLAMGVGGQELAMLQAWDAGGVGPTQIQEMSQLAARGAEASDVESLEAQVGSETLTPAREDGQLPAVDTEVAQIASAKDAAAQSGARVDGESKSALSHVGDFFVGAYEGGRDMVTGVASMAMGANNLVNPVVWATDPARTARTWSHLKNTTSAVVNNPGTLWDAFKKPFVDDWTSGHPGKAIGRGAFEVVSLVVGTKGLDKAAKGSKLGKAADLAADISKVDDVGRLGSGVDDVGRLANQVDDVGRLDDIARASRVGDDSFMRLTVDDMVKQDSSVASGTRLLDDRGSALGEMDITVSSRGLIIEDKSAAGLSRVNPQTGLPVQTPVQWAEKQILKKTERRIEAVTEAVATGPSKGGTVQVPSLDAVRQMKSFLFRIEAADSALMQAVETQLSVLRSKHPDFSFDVIFDVQNIERLP